jgi:hypothetical protein
MNEAYRYRRRFEFAKRYHEHATAHSVRNLV